MGLEIFRTVSRGDEFGWGYQASHGKDLIAGIISHRGPQTIRAGQDQGTVLLHLPLDHEREYLVGRRAFRSTPDSAILIPPMHTYTCHSPAGDFLGLVIKHSTLMRLVNQRWVGRAGHCTLKPIELQVTPQLGKLLRDRAQSLGIHTDMAEGSESAGRALSNEEDLLVGIADAMAAQQGLQPLSPRRKVRIEALEKWIDAHLQADISVQAMATVSGVKPHTLTKTILAGRGVSPKELVLSRRLTAANRLLLTDSKSVSDAAYACGINHLGRFAAAYRRAFGESPSDTLNKRKPTDRAS